MSGPPPGHRPENSNRTTGTCPKAATKPASQRRQAKRALVGRVKDHARRRGIELDACRIRSVLQILAEAGQIVQPTDEQIMESLMRASNWRPKQRIRKVA